ncbi:MAG: hypothetical protein ACR2OZ_03610 [Verrucomicrobiales bacterium]
MRCPLVHRLRRLVALTGLLAGLEVRAAEPVAILLYDKDPSHVWNRLYSALMARAPEAEAAVKDLLDPPFWSDTDHLLDGATNRTAVALLGEFVHGPPRPDSMSALQRAVMQRDLLAIFHWIADHHRKPWGRLEWTAPMRGLFGALARAIHHVALSDEEIRKLPDNYAAAVAAPDAVTTFDAAHPTPFLPNDLLADDGPWIALEPNGDDGLAATFHFTFFNGRSAFEVRMRHPDGRAAGEAYLKQLAEMRHPFVSEKPANVGRFMPNSDPPLGPWVNPETPQFPPGTMWALVRRAVVAGAKGAPVVSPLVESVQIRVYRNFDIHSEQAQTFFEWETRRALLLGKTGFHLTTPLDQAYASFPGGDHRKQTTLNCFQCHSGPGIHSVQSRVRIFEERLVRPPDFRAVNRARVDEITTVRARSLPGWTLLQWLWDDQPAR